MKSFTLLCFIPAVLCSGFRITDKTDCRQAMLMVQKYLHDSKLELIKNIQHAKEQTCKAQAWRKVQPSMVSHTHAQGASYELKGNAQKGLKVKVKVTDKQCGVEGSHFAMHIKGNWTQIMYTQRFMGSAKCWAIFGKERSPSHHHKAGVEEFSESLGDIIFGQVKMSSKKEDSFDGTTMRCDDEEDNFWHSKNGQGTRKATVILRRSAKAEDAGISTDTSCGTPTYFLEDIYVLL